MKNKFKQIISLIVILSLLLSYVPTAFASLEESVARLSPLQKQLSQEIQMNQGEENEQAEEGLSPEEQEVLDRINNNPMITSEDVSSTEVSTFSVGAAEATVQSNVEPMAIQENGIQTLSASSGSVPDGFRIEPVGSVYNISNNNNDYVSQATGALTYEKTILSLPGTNGLDLNLSVRYNSGEAVITQNEFADTDETERKINFNSFAVGWSFGFPTIIISGTDENYGWDKETCLMFPDGSTYNIGGDINYPGADTTLDIESYLLSDMTLVKKAGSNNYELAYANGTVYTFDGTYGNITRITDIYNNQINFYYTEMDYYRGSFLDYMFNPSYYNAKINALTKIVDSAGREINLEYAIKNTAYGKQVLRISINMEKVTYASMVFEHISSKEGTATILSQITDGEGYTTKFSYDEKVTHIFTEEIYGAQEAKYLANGSVIALTNVELPTGGNVNYEYEKARRAYSYYIPDTTITAWYDVYKISKVSSMGDFDCTYEYENDRSGYPYSRLDVAPIMPEGYSYSGTTTGYVKDSTFTYSCLAKKNGKVTVSTFDYKHNKIREYVYNESNSQNKYVTGQNKPEWSVLIGDSIYHMGFIDTNPNITSKKTFLYKQNISTGEITILKAYGEKLSTSAVVKNQGNNIYVFYTTGSGTTASPYKLVAKQYDIITDTWSNGGEITTGALSLNNIRYGDSKFYVWYRTSATIYHAIYDPSKAISQRWTLNQQSISTTSHSFQHICQVENKVYYNNYRTIYEYDLDSNTITSKNFNLNGAYWGFAIGTRTFVDDGMRVREFDYESGTILATYTYADFEALNDYSTILNESSYTVRVGADGGIYYIMNVEDSDGYINIYKFDPDAVGDNFVLVGSRMMNNSASYILSAGTAKYPQLVFVSNGIETMRLEAPTNAQSTSVAKTTYNDDNQPLSVVLTRMSGVESKEVGTESYTYVSGYNVLASSTDILGNKTTYEYTDSPYYIPTKITQYADTDNALETVYTLSEDKKKVILEQTEYEDRTIFLQYDYGDINHPGNVTCEYVHDRPAGATIVSFARVRQYTYDTGGALITRVSDQSVQTNDSNFSLVLAPDKTTSYTYNSLGLVTSETDSLGRTTQYEYNKNGWNTKVTYPDNTTKTIAYSIKGKQKNAVTTTLNNCYTVIDELDYVGELVRRKEKQPDGTEIELFNHLRMAGNRIAITTDALGNYSVYDYDSFDRVTEVSQYDSSGTLLSQNKVTFDDFNMTRTINNSGKISKTYYDIAGRLIKEEAQTDAGLAATRTYYDHMGNVSRTISPKNEEILYSYNDRGLLTSVTDPAGGVVSYQYDALGNLLTVTNAAEVIQTNTYDTLGRVLSTTDAMGMTERYQYDAGGRVVKAQDRNGVITTNTYKDKTNYLEKQVKGDTEQTFTYDNFGNMLTATNATGTYTYSYTFNNLLESVTTPDSKQIEYGYDANHNLTQVTDYSGDVINYTLNGLNQVDTILRNDALVADYDYYNFGALKKITYPNQGTSEFGYDNALRLTSQTNSLADSTVVNAYTYEYDLNGNQTKKTDNGNITQYAYDSLGRLQSVAEPDGTNTAYTFDTQGNIMTKTVTHPASYEFAFTQDGTDYEMSNLSTHQFLYAYDKNNRLMMETEHVAGVGEDYAGFLEITKQNEYDNNGNLLKTTKGGQIDESVVEYAYNSLNQLTAYTDSEGAITSYTYNPDGLRNSKTQNGNTTNFYWDRGYMSAETIGGTFTAKNHIGATGIFARETSTGTDYMLKNGHGDVTALVNNGVVTQTYDYDAYGVQKNINANDTNPFRYAGEYQDAESGLFYLRARYYDPYVPRFTTMDTHWNVANMIYGDKEYKESEKKTPNLEAILQANNLYVYALNNPVIYVDPSGEGIILATIVVCAFIGGTIGGITAAELSKSKLGYIDGTWVLTGAVGGALVGGLVGWGVGEVVTALGLTATAGSTGTLGPALYQTWQEAESALRTTINGIKQSFNTPFGMRIVDAYNSANRVIAEAKYGYASLSEFIKTEIAKDSYLLQNSLIDSVEWHFYTSNVTGMGGPSKPLLEALIAEGFKVIFH